GDDCAVLPPSRRRRLVTVDPVVFGEHFDDNLPPAAAGAKLMRRNLSDIAAMGGRPSAAVVSLALDPSVKTAWLRQFYRGLAQTALRHGVRVVGGDITRLRGGLAASLTLVGEASPARVLTRSGARRGDRLFVTGELGGSLLGKHWRFEPRLAEGAWLARQPAVRSLTDVSDGLAKDALPLRPAGCVAAVDPARVPVSAAAQKLSRRDNLPPLAHALCDGEDYELLFALDGRADAARFETAWRRRFPKLRLSRVGVFAARTPAGFVNLGTFHGYEHFR
ncbi:MAG: thiamine-phosphate kinase, partial [Opitutaceae bacterium]|nr:thiamine-phosphate kinase [Opitutaceae bacterium]